MKQGTGSPSSSDLGRLRVLHVAGEIVHASRGYDLLVSRDAGRVFEQLTHVPMSLGKRLVRRSRYAERLFRAGLDSLAVQPCGGLVATLRGAIAAWTPGDAGMRITHCFPDRVRTLGVEVAPSGTLYCGEYSRNPERREVAVLGSTDGAGWHVVHTFPAQSVRHVHSVVADPWRRGLWVLTGDYGDEVGLWFTSDEFATLERVAGGTQSLRAVRVVPLQDGLVLPMDSAQEPNFVNWFDTRTCAVTRLAPLPGSVMHIGRAGGRLVLSTTVEPSPVNQQTSAAVMVCDPEVDLEVWHTLLEGTRDLQFLGGRYPLMQYPTWLLPGGTGNPRWVFATGRGLRGSDGRLVRASLAAPDEFRQEAKEAA